MITYEKIPDEYDLDVCCHNISDGIGDKNVICHCIYCYDPIALEKEDIKLSITAHEGKIKCPYCHGLIDIFDLVPVNLIREAYGLPRIEDVQSYRYEQGRRQVVDKIRAEIDRQEKWLLQAGCNTYNVDIALDAIKLAVAESEDNNEPE